MKIKLKEERVKVLFVFVSFFNLEQNLATDSEKKVNWTLTRDESLNFRAAHWGDLHGVLYESLPPQIFLWGHIFLSFHVANEKGHVIVKAKVVKTGEVIEIVGDLLVAADGCLSSIRRKYLPDFKLRSVSKLNLAFPFL